MEEYDLRYVNKMDSGEPTVGSTIIIPPLITLPRIDPKAKVGDNPYQIDIVYNSVQQGGRIVPDDRIVVRDLKIEYAPTQVYRERVQRNDIPHGKDVLGNGRVISVQGIWNNLAVGVTDVSDYEEDLDYVLDGNFISWAPTEGLSQEPTGGADYYVTYTYNRVKSITITMGSDYEEEGGVNRVWRSPEVKEFSGTCSPGVDHKAELPSATTWEGASDPNIEDLEYIVEDNDLWVKTWIQQEDTKYYAIGSLQDRIPKDNWFPTIETGFYYAGKDEYYLFSESIRVEPTDAEMARSENIKYVDGKYEKAAQFQKASTNVVRNSGFEVATGKGIVQKITFSDDVVIPPPPDTTPPDVPSGLNGTVGDGMMMVTWGTVSNADFAGYNIYVDGVKYNTSGLHVTTDITIPGTNGTAYSIEVSSVDTTGNESAHTAPISLTPEKPPLTAVYEGASFSGNSTYGQAGVIDWVTNNGLTLDFVMYHDPAANSDWDRIVQRGDGDNVSGFAFRTYLGGLVFYVSGNGGNNTYVETVSKGWHRITLRHVRGSGAENQEIWIDGVKATTTIINDGPGSTTDDFFVGRRAGTDDSYVWKGTMRNLRFWNRALTSEEMTQVFGGTRITTGLAGEWFTVAFSGTTVNDTSGNGMHMTLSGGVQSISNYLPDNNWEQGTFSDNGEGAPLVKAGGSSRIRTKEYVNIDPNSSYTLSANFGGVYQVMVYTLDANDNMVQYLGWYTAQTVITTDATEIKIAARVSKVAGTATTPADIASVQPKFIKN
jgi:hypothetical protein